MVLSGCASVGLIVPKVPDVELCTNLGTKGWCRHTISNNPRFITGKDWQAYLGKAVIVPAAGWAEFKTWTETICHQVDCSNGVGSWDKVVSDLNTHLR